MELVATQKMPSAFAPHVTRAELYAAGEQLRKTCPRSSHADWKPSKTRPDPVSLIEEADKGRIPQAARQKRIEVMVDRGERHGSA